MKPTRIIRRGAGTVPAGLLDLEGALDGGDEAPDR
jgi:hypothetical protein